MRPLRFVALGDSLTEGVGDPVGEGWRGWAALLVDGLSDGPDMSVEFTNLAVSGPRRATSWNGRPRRRWPWVRTWCPS